jgi:hypothetical protein
MREDAAEQYLAYKLIDSNQGWKSKWFFVTNHHPKLPNLRTMCGSRTGEWSLPCVMSD